MKLAYQEIELLLPFSKGSANELVIENKPLFFRLVSDLTAQGEGQSGVAVLSVNNEPVEFHKYADITTSFTPFPLNRKSLITKLLGTMEKRAFHEDHLLETNKLLSNLEAYADRLADDLPLTLHYNKL